MKRPGILKGYKETRYGVGDKPEWAESRKVARAKQNCETIQKSVLYPERGLSLEELGFFG